MSFFQMTIDSAVDMIMGSFSGDREPSPADVTRQVDEFLLTPLLSHLRASRTEIVNEVLRRARVVVGAAACLEDDRDHIEWLGSADRSTWRFWPRLQAYLKDVDHLPPAIIRELDNSTDRTIELLESPSRQDNWDRRGLVVGHVQSGKTTHYTALAAKSMDAGYQIIIILAGIHNNLRSQTHERIDKHLIGRHSAALVEAVRRDGSVGVTIGIFGVGEEDRRRGRPELPCAVLTVTSSAEDGDFRTVIANQIGFQVGATSRLVLVVKKHRTILRNLISWLRVQNSGGQLWSESFRIPAPALVIDDEADHASMNIARDPETEASKINELIRKLLVSFDHVGFVGYTATPFANIFAQHDLPGDHLGPDLFPKSFIINLKSPSDYIGPAVVFGHPGDESAGIPSQLPLPMYVPVDDSDSWIPGRHRSNFLPGPAPASLREAIQVFVLACAARVCRGDRKVHNSMLVHTTRFVNVQARVATQVEQIVDALLNILESGGESDRKVIVGEFEDVWQRRFFKSHVHFERELGDRCLPLPLWAEVRANINEVLARLSVMRINGTSADILAYSREPDGLQVIVIGGDKLSRGLTLEGLSVSYFLRTTNMYDTLMQMGRWFGYRPRYADLCRVFTTPRLYEAFREIALAMDDLRSDLDYMAAIGKTPYDFGLRVRTPSDGLLITAANKIRRGEEVQVRFAGELVQTLELARTGVQADQNRTAVKKLFRSMGDPVKTVRGQATSHHLWHGVDVGIIMEFLSCYEAYSTPSFCNHCEALRRYITEQTNQKPAELVAWTVAVIGKKHPGQTALIGNTVFPLIFRTRKEGTAPDRFETQAVVGSADECVDLSLREYEKALSTAQGPEGSRRAFRGERPAQRGLLLVYLIEDKESGRPDMFIPCIAISFPTSTTAEPLAYTVNRVWLENRGLIMELDDDAAIA